MQDLAAILSVEIAAWFAKLTMNGFIGTPRKKS
jgi:hypothetical protein